MTITSYKNGNSNITLESDGTRVILYDGILKLDYPLNIDIRVSTKCSFGQKPNGDYVLCNFCHESAKTNGKECNYRELQSKLKELPAGIELAIGSNKLTPSLFAFLAWCFNKGFICNLTVNQGHLIRDNYRLQEAVNLGYIKGLGISYRNSLKFNVSQWILDYPNTVFHVISGIDTYEEVKNLSSKGVKKILVLGEKDFGFNQGNVDLTSSVHKSWLWNIGQLFNIFEVVSFDNLAIEQLKIKRFFNKFNWEKFYQGEHSFYINAVDKYYSPSSRNTSKTDWNISIRDYFKTL